MLSTLTNSTIFSSANTLLVATLLCTLKANCASAEINEPFRKEPISPIPQEIKVDQDKADLGEMLFYDTRLSDNNQLACASCHQLETGGDDNLAMGISMVAGQHVINTPSIFNVRFNFRQNWDGSVKSLHEQIEMAIKSDHAFRNNWGDIVIALSHDSELTDDFYQVYQQGISRENIIDALVEFEKTLITPNSRFDRFLRNEEDVLTDDEIKGYLVFKDLGCISCHQGINIGGNLYQKFGVFYNYIGERGDIRKSDYGRMNTTNRQVDAFVFKVPSLRNVAVTAPYLHDGSAATLEEVIDIMAKTQLGRTLSVDETYLIKTFLNTLTGEYKGQSLADPS